MKKIQFLLNNLNLGNILHLNSIQEGLTNQNYYVKTTKGSFVIRMEKNDNNFLCLDRENEEKTLQILSRTNINVPVIFYNKHVLITQYFPVDSSLDYLNQPILSKIVSTLKAIHSLDVVKSELHDFNPFILLMKYKKNAEHLPAFHLEEKVVSTCQKIYSTYPKVLCHNDVLFANILINKNQEIHLIDWEYSGLNIALFDIVSLISENNIEDEPTQFFILKQYFHDVTPSLLHDFNYIFLLEDLLWFYWAYDNYQLYHEEIYSIIAKGKQKRYEIRSHNL